MRLRVCCAALLFAFVLTTSMRSQNLGKDVTPEAQKKVRSGNSLYDKGSYDEAAKEYESAIALAPNWYEPHYELAQTYSRLKRTDDARKEFQLALERDANCWLCYQGLGNLEDDLGNTSLALQHYQKAVALAPNQGQPHYNLAITYVRLKRIDDAISELKEAEQRKPEYPSPYFLLGKIYYSQKRFYLAFDQLFQAEKIEKTGARFEQAKKLTDFQVTVDEKLDGDSIAPHMAYCLVRSGAMSPEEYRKRFPGAETYVEDLKEEEYVLGKLATIVDEFPKQKKGGADFERLVSIKKAGYLVPFILTYSGERFGKDTEEYEKNNPAGMETFRRWAAENKISLDPIRARCQVSWMGQAW